MNMNLDHLLDDDRAGRVLRSVSTWRAYTTREIIDACLSEPAELDRWEDNRDLKPYIIRTALDYGGFWFAFSEGNGSGFWVARDFPPLFTTMFIFSTFGCAEIGPAWHRANPGFLPRYRKLR